MRAGQAPGRIMMLAIRTRQHSRQQTALSRWQMFAKLTDNQNN